MFSTSLDPCGRLSAAMWIADVPDSEFTPQVPLDPCPWEIAGALTIHLA